MPRKVDYGFRYEDDNYDVYEDYDYDYADDYDYEEEENGIAPVTKAKQEASRTGVWRCPICTYDNENSMSACDICGVLRNPLVKVNNKGDTAAAAFKFDAPSPDDLVSNGLRSVKSKSKGEDSRGRGTNFLVESELAANGLVSSSTSVTRERHNGVEENDSTSGSGNKPETFNTRMDTESLPSKSGKARSIIERKTESISQYIPEKWMTPNNKDDGLSQLNLAIVGHVDSGKSTLSGRMLHLLGRISQKEMHKYEKEAKQQGKGSFAFAWALDESAEERERGITMTVGVAFFTSRKYHVVLLDSPGHRDFVPNMISGATQADAAILVVDASMGSFEAGIDAIGGQTREHAQLIRSFGVDQIIIVVNKMDVVEYSKERFDVIKQKLGTFLRSCGFKDSSILWIPASAMENQNLVANPSEARLSWFKGPSLLDAIDSLQLPERDYSKPLLMPICDVIKSQSQGQVTACGKLESGAIRTGSKVLVMPSGITATARSLERDSQLCNIARAGDNVTVNLQGIEGNQVTAGGVICHPDYPVQVTNRLQLKILVLDISTPIVMGSQLEFHIHHAKEAARIVKILSLLDPKTGNTTKKSPRCLLAKQNAIVEVVLQGPVCVEEYSSCRALGRVFLRSSGRTIALGIVTQVIKREE
ncbi:HBS1-like protein isoform X5 [Sesamum indicum]|uniref:HBS1-like protein isoform X5 n=1 Tax=Sesamum indicum TaxID=4182 RepID=A0A8M8V6P3_SESIN|nr:HBS1-like protein isoform X5 [Sesamum indicum]